MIGGESLKQKFRVGDEYRFRPAALMSEGNENGNHRVEKVTGTITYINHAHRYFLVEYRLNGYRM